MAAARNRLDHFRELVAAPAAPPPPIDADEIVQPLRDLAQALEDRAGVGAKVQTSDDRRRHYLALWPLHRPAFRSVMVSVAVENGRILVLGNNPWLALPNADALEQWLDRFVQLPTFRDALDVLRAQAREPVDARLEQDLGLATLVQVLSEQQAALAAVAPGAAYQIEVPLQDGEPIPDVGRGTWRLNSAGVRFDVRHVTLSDRNVGLDLVKMQ